MRLDRLLRSSWQALSPSPWRPTDAPFVNSTTLEPSPTVYRPAKPERRRGSPSLRRRPGSSRSTTSSSSRDREPTLDDAPDLRTSGERISLGLGPRRVAPRRGLLRRRGRHRRNLDALFAEAAQYVENVTGEKGLRRPKRQDPDLIKDLRRGVAFRRSVGRPSGCDDVGIVTTHRCQDVRVPRCQESYKVELPEYQDARPGHRRRDRIDEVRARRWGEGAGQARGQGSMRAVCPIRVGRVPCLPRLRSSPSSRLVGRWPRRCYVQGSALSNR